MDPRFPAGLPFPVPETPEFLAFGDSGKIFQQFSWNFPGTFLQNSRKDPRNSHSLLEFSDSCCEKMFHQHFSKFGSPPQVYTKIGRKHPSRDVIFFGQNLAKKMPKIISLHDVLEPLKQALLASRDVIISSQICGSNSQKVFTLGDRCCLPKEGLLHSANLQGWPRSHTAGAIMTRRHRAMLKEKEVGHWNPKYGCRGTVTACFALIALVVQVLV